MAAVPCEQPPVDTMQNCSHLARNLATAITVVALTTTVVCSLHRDPV